MACQAVDRRWPGKVCRGWWVADNPRQILTTFPAPGGRLGGRFTFSLLRQASAFFFRQDETGTPDLLSNIWYGTGVLSLFWGESR